MIPFGVIADKLGWRTEVYKLGCWPEERGFGQQRRWRRIRLGSLPQEGEERQE